MSRTPIDQLIPRADRRIISAFPRVAQRLESQVDDMDRAEMDTFLKLLPGAIERFQAVTTHVNDLHESVETAIIQLVAGFPQKTFGSQSVSEGESASHVDASNMSHEAEEPAEGVSDSDQPEGSDTIQERAASSLPHNELGAVPGNSGELLSAQADPRNPRVRTASRLQGRKAGRRSQQASSESADNHD